jgi:hypothetical protein
VLATENSDARRVTDIMTIPLLGGACAILLLLGLQWAGNRGADEAAFSVVTAIGTQLTLLVYFAPGLYRIGLLAHRRAGMMPPSWTRLAMRALAASADAELLLLIARSATLIARASGLGTTEPTIAAIGTLQGIVVIGGLGGLAVGPAVISVSAGCTAWITYWRLRPLRALVQEAVPYSPLSTRAWEGSASERAQAQLP